MALAAQANTSWDLQESTEPLQTWGREQCLALQTFPGANGGLWHQDMGQERVSADGMQMLGFSKKTRRRKFWGMYEGVR